MNSEKTAKPPAQSARKRSSGWLRGEAPRASARPTHQSPAPKQSAASSADAEIERHAPQRLADRQHVDARPPRPRVRRARRARGAVQRAAGTRPHQSSGKTSAPPYQIGSDAAWLGELRGRLRALADQREARGVVDEAVAHLREERPRARRRAPGRRRRAASCRAAAGARPEAARARRPAAAAPASPTYFVSPAAAAAKPAPSSAPALPLARARSSSATAQSSHAVTATSSWKVVASTRKAGVATSSAVAGSASISARAAMPWKEKAASNGERPDRHAQPRLALAEGSEPRRQPVGEQRRIQVEARGLARGRRVPDHLEAERVERRGSDPPRDRQEDRLVDAECRAGKRRDREQRERRHGEPLAPHDGSAASRAQASR